MNVLSCFILNEGERVNSSLHLPTPPETPCTYSHVKERFSACVDSNSAQSAHPAHGNSQVKPLYHQVYHYKQGMLNLGQLNLMLCK